MPESSAVFQNCLAVNFMAGKGNDIPLSECYSLSDWPSQHFWATLNFYVYRIPLQVNLEATDLQKEIKRALHLTMCSINGGSSWWIVFLMLLSSHPIKHWCLDWSYDASFFSLIPIGNTQMAEAKVADNILRSVCVLAQQLPGGSANIHSLHLKLTDSPALPLYFSRSKCTGFVPTPRN